MITDQQTYRLVNGLLLLGLILLGFWAAWGTAQPRCVYEAQGLTCLGCGSTRALGGLVRGQLSTAQSYGPITMSLATFFPLFALSRLIFLLLSLRRSWSKLWRWDVALAILLFLACFGPLIWLQFTSGPTG